MEFYKRNLPHWHPPNAEFFITIRLANSLPKSAVKKLKYQRDFLRETNHTPSNIQEKIFKKYEQLLDKAHYGPTWLSNPEIADIVASSIKYRDNKIYDLYCFCIMANHVHLIFRVKQTEAKIPNNKKSKNHPTFLTKILQELKRYTAREANKILGRSGQFWQRESYDRVIRNHEELEKTIVYVLNNPVKANLVRHWKDWPYSYCKPEFLDNL